MSSSGGWVGRLLWLLRAAVPLCCLLAAGLQTWQLVARFLSEPIDTAMRRAAVHQMPVPSVTVCQLGPYPDPHLLPLQQITPTQLRWSQGATLQGVLVNCDPSCFTAEDTGSAAPEVPVAAGSWRTWAVDTFYTTCHTFTPNVSAAEVLNQITYITDSKVQSSGPVLLDLSVWHRTFHMFSQYVPYGVHLFVHSDQQPVVANPGVEGLQPDGWTFLPPHDNIQLLVTSELTVREPLRRAPCSAEPHYRRELCLTDCLFAARAACFGCRSPQMVDSHPELPECRSVPALTLRLNASEAADCGCPTACRQLTYTVQLERRDKKTHEEHGMPIISLRLVTERYPHTEVVERATYRLVSLLSEIGGYVGLLLGTSALSLLHLGLQLAERAYRWWHGGDPLQLTTG
ncbi:Acid-sensing ion channel 3 [Amphibalanus amphitrite]|uniref:Acid-sensing ion channel 3 n=1 Tax=Amphibalanus amphitrite TaxID=1232801 RepID=A0A6A4X2U5_AMPAM|nr:Acid-sensing ion channel 3 [Amphibalanus amphitrite]